MTGGLLQLVAYGAQDIYLTGNPQITFFKTVYRRHTNFALESILQFTTDVSEQKEVEFAIPIKRGADLLTDIQIDFAANTNFDTFTIPSPPGYIAYQLIEYAELLIGGKSISKIYGEWMMVWSELTLRKNTNRDPFEACIRSEGGIIPDSDIRYTDIPYYSNTRLPLLFWFHNNPGLAVPLIALQYDDVVLNLRFKDRRRVVYNYYDYPGEYTDYNTFPPITVLLFPKEFDISGWENYPSINVKVYAEFAFLESGESKQFAQNPHEYLMEQVQYVSQSSISVANTTLNLNFNHPVKSLIWYALSSKNDLSEYELAQNGNTTVSKYGKGVFVSNSYEYAKLILNGKDRLAKRKISYFERYQVYKYFPGLSPVYRSNYPSHFVPDFPYPVLIDQHYYPIPVSVYSFAMRPFASEPSGTCNFSIISDARLVLENITQANRLDTFKVWAQNYNLLRISAGQGGVAYSN